MRAVENVGSAGCRPSTMRDLLVGYDKGFGRDTAAVAKVQRQDGKLRVLEILSGRAAKEWIVAYEATHPLGQR